MPLPIFWDIWPLPAPLSPILLNRLMEEHHLLADPPFHLSGWRHLWMAPKEEGKCLSASEHHRITPSYTDSTSELPLLSFVFSSIFFLSFKVSYTHWKAILFGLCWQEDFFNQNVAKLFCNNVPAAATNIFQKRMMAPQVENYIDKRVLSTQEFIQKKNIPIFAIEVWVIMGILV